METEKSTKERTKEPTKETTNNSHKEYAREEALLETAEEVEQKEDEETTEAEEKGQVKSEGPTDKQVKKWIKDNKFECEQKDCTDGLGGRPFRCKKMGGMNFHNYNSHGIGAKPKGKEGKQKIEPEGADIMEEIVKRTEAADLRGKLTVAIKRITRLGKDDREALEPELAMVKSWKNQSLKKDITDEEINYIEGELASNILPTIKDMEDDAKKEKKKTVEKKTKRAEDDDDDDLLGYGDMKQELKMLKVRSAMDEAREDREAARRRREREDERRDEEHHVRMQALKGGGGFVGGGGSNNPLGLVYERTITFKHDEDGNVVLGENGQPIPESMRETPVNPNAIVQSQGRRGDGGDNLLKTLETYHKLTKGDEDARKEEVTELKEDRKAFMDKLEKMTLANTTKEIYGDMSKLAGAITDINKKLDDDKEDTLESYMAMQDRLKEHNIYPDGGTSPEAMKVELEIQREKTRRSTDLMMMNKTFKIAETAIGKLTDGPIAKQLAKKIGQDDIIGEEEELPEDVELEADIEEEVAPPPEQPPPENPQTRKISKRTKKNRK